MTVVVGVLCEDGVVVGSDSSATFGVGPNFRTIEQPAKKTFVVSEVLILSGTGQVGMGQRFESLLIKLRSQQKFENKGHIEVGKLIAKTAIEDFAETHCDKGQYGALVAFECNDGIHLCEFATTDFQPEFKTDTNWFASIGSGQPITDPFLALLRRVFFRGAKPKLKEGIFLVAWALDHAIETNPGGINAPMQIAVLEKRPDAKRYSARLLDEQQLAEHKAGVDGAELHLAHTVRFYLVPPQRELPCRLSQSHR